MGNNLTKQRNPEDFLDVIDCHMGIYQEKIQNNGEDAYLFSINKTAALIGVFDGCGGSGAKRYTKLSRKTGAYIASRIVSGSVKAWFGRSCSANNGFQTNTLQEEIKSNLQFCNTLAEEDSKILSPMVKVFPTTAAFAVCSPLNNQIIVDYFWAGDSRVYVLDSDGLAQLSVDDLSVPDAMENLYDDGIMTNVISLSKEFVLHHGQIALKEPAIVFAATDGCFAYLPTPMDFEYLLIDHLLSSASVSEFESRFTNTLALIAGDDFTLSGIAIGYGSFSELKKSLAQEGNLLYSQYISRLQESERDEKTNLWEIYKEKYLRYTNLPPKNDCIE